MYELKQYENFTNNSLEDPTSDLNNLKFNINNNINNNGASRKNHLNTSGHNYNNNILNYNNSYYKINNINNYNCIKNQSSPSSYYNHQKYYNKHQDKLLLNDRMEKEETIVERSQLVSTGSNANGHNVIIHNFTNNNNNNANQNSNANNHIHNEDEEQNNVNPCNHRSQHYTQVGALKTYNFSNFNALHKLSQRILLSENMKHYTDSCILNSYVCLIFLV